MYYRLSCVLNTGEIIGYQWREVDQDTFVAIARGQRPLGDADAHSRDQNGSPVYYGHVWNNGWQTELDADTATALYSQCGQAAAGA